MNFPQWLPFAGAHTPRVASYLRPHLKRLVVTIGLQLGLTAIEVLKPWPFRFVIDYVIGNRPLTFLTGTSKTQLLLLCCLFVVLIYAVSAIVQVIFVYANLSLGRRLVSSLRGDLYSHFQRLPWQFHLNRSKGDLIYRLTTDTVAFQQYFNSGLLPLVSNGLSVLAMIVILFRLNTTLALSSVGVLPLLILLGRPFLGVIARRSHRMKLAESKFLELVQKGVSNIQMTQLFSQEKRELADFLSQNKKSMDTSVAFYLSQSVYSAVITLFIGIWVAVFIAVGAQQVMSGQITIGILTVYVNYLAVILISISQASTLIGSLRSSMTGLERVFHILDEKSSLVEGRLTTKRQVFEGDIEFHNVSFGYSEDTKILADLNLKLPAGKRIAIVGPTGAGKTTLINLILRCYDPQHGDVLIGGVNIKELTFESLRKNMTYVQQPPLVFPGTILENLLYADPEAPFSTIVRAAKTAQIHSYIESLPDGYDTFIGERSQSLSQGQLQRLSIARALIRDVPIIILDEPTSALDTETEAAIVQGLKTLTSGKTTITIAHRLSTIKASDLILVMEHGRIIEADNYDRLVMQGGLFAKLHHQSFGLS